MEQYTEYVEALRRAIENKFGQSVSAPSEFERLRDSMFATLGETLSISTIKRVWGYVNGYESVRTSTLNTMARYVGFRDWKEFCETQANPDASTFPLQGVLVISTLAIGDRVEVTWSPGRRIVVQYMGQMRLCVVESERSKLTVGTKFTCSGMVNGERLTVTQVETPGAKQALVYTCGKHGGITARVLPLNAPTRGEC